jgi:hypothetical protein
MSAVIKWNTSASRQVKAVTLPKWHAVRQGLVLALFGQSLALLLGLAGLVLVATKRGALAEWLSLIPEDAVIIGWGLLGGSLFGCLLLLVGQLCCLSGAPDGHGAKDLLYVWMHCTLVVPACFAGAQFLGGSATYAALERGPAHLLDVGLQQGGPLIQLIGLAVILVGVLLFGAFVRALHRCLNDDKGTRSVTSFFWFVAFLIGATGGLFLQAGRTLPPSLYPGMGVAWALCLLWQGLLVLGAVGRIGRFLSGEQPAGRSPEPVVQAKPGQVVLQAAAYLPRR